MRSRPCSWYYTTECYSLHVALHSSGNDHHLRLIASNCNVIYKFLKVLSNTWIVLIHFYPFNVLQSSDITNRNQGPDSLTIFLSSIGMWYLKKDKVLIHRDALFCGTKTIISLNIGHACMFGVKQNLDSKSYSIGSNGLVSSTTFWIVQGYLNLPGPLSLVLCCHKEQHHIIP